MKIIHCADLHLGGALNDAGSLGGEERRQEIRATFGRIVQYAGQNGAEAILLAGDVFDSDRPFLRDKKFFYDVITANPSIEFYYLRGNHDNRAGYELSPKNLHTFSNSWTKWRQGDVCICGTELPCKGDLYDRLELDEKLFNIAMLHGQINADFSLARLRHRGIDYLALGHIHSYSYGDIDERGKYAYSGCTEGRGFDETGEKGFILLDTLARSFAFVPFASRTIRQCDIDVTGCSGAYSIAERIRTALPPDGKTIVRFYLCGEINFSDERLAEDVEKYLSPLYGCVTVRDRTTVRADYAKIAAEQTLKGQFCRDVLKDGSLEEGERQRIVRLGTAVLDGREVGE